VYYGRLPDGQEIAVKVLDKKSVQGSSEFLNEVQAARFLYLNRSSALAEFVRFEIQQ
jgi:hypothetical protein